MGFMRQEAHESRFESTTSEIARGVGLSYNQVARVVERLILRDQIGFRERGNERKSVRYFYLTDVLNACRELWQ